MSRLTLKTVNKHLAEAGLDVSLNQGKDYLYFSGSGTDGWSQTSVYTPRLNDLTLADWVSEAKTMGQRACLLVLCEMVEGDEGEAEILDILKGEDLQKAIDYACVNYPRLFPDITAITMTPGEVTFL